MRWRKAFWLRAFICSLLPIFLHFGLPQAAAAEQAILKIRGAGLIGNLELRRTLLLLETGGEKRDYFDATFVEDGVAILKSRLSQEGYPRATITAQITLENGSKIPFASETVLPRNLRAKEVKFHLKNGVLYYYTQINFTGLETVPTETAMSYFVPTGVLFPFKRNRVYSPQRLKRGITSLTETLQRQGYRDAQVTSSVKQNDQTGEVSVEIRVNQGMKSIVRSVEENTVTGQSNVVATQIVYPNKPYSALWEEDFVQSLKTNYYHAGFPDVNVKISQISTQAQGSVLQWDLKAQIEEGPLVHIGKVRFEGEEKTKMSVMQDRIDMKPGELLDRIRAERARFRLARLGIFQSVGLRYDKVDENTSDPVYTVKEGKWLEAYMMASFGSYELLRVGFEIDQHNIWGLAHNAELRVSQSFKTSAGTYFYDIPDVGGEDLSLFFNASALRREEISFLHEEYGGGVGMNKYFRDLSFDLRPRLNFELLTASGAVDPLDGLSRARVGSFILETRFDQRDNALYPRRGYKIFSTLEVASQYLGGEVNYQRFDLQTSGHIPLGPGHWLHLALDHGFVFTDRPPSVDLPYPRRFFPGGENSVRGYTQGEAAPRNEFQTVVGAESYLLGTVQIEQLLTPKTSLVLFVDSVGLARRIQNYPSDQVLASVGGGINWRTIVGPVRLEYGYNLNRRPGDPAGTLQFSVGFPF